MRRFRILPLLMALALTAPAQDAALRDAFLQAKALWSEKGEREGASNGIDKVISTLKGKELTPAWRQILCEAYNWLAVLDDRSATQKARATLDLEAIIDLDPDFEIDRAITPDRLQKQFDGLRNTKLAKVKLSFDPEGGVLKVDGKVSPMAGTKLLPLGPHTLTYVKPGYALQELKVEAVAKDSPAADFKLTRTSSTVRLFVNPIGAEILLDGKPAGKATGTAPAEFSELAEKAGLKITELSAPFLLAELTPGKHILELRAPCYVTKLISIEPEHTQQPFKDNPPFEPFKLEPSKGLLTVTSAWPDGELFLNGVKQGAVPVQQLEVCSDKYALEVRFPSGGFAETVVIEKGKTLTIAAKPKPRLVFLGFSGDDEFPLRARLQSQLMELGGRLQTVAYFSRAGQGAPGELLNQLKAARGAELFLRVEARKEGPTHRVELVLSTPEGEEERYPINTLEQDPLGHLVTPLNQPPRLQQPWAGLSLVDMPGEPGPWVLQTLGPAVGSGIVPLKPITQVNGRPVADVEAFRRELEQAKEAQVSVVQGGKTFKLPLGSAPLEIPLGDPGLSYALLLAETRLRMQGAGAKGEAAGVLRFQQGLALMHFRKYERAVELMRDAKLGSGWGVGQGTLDYYIGLCLLRLGSANTSLAIQAFAEAAKSPTATLFGPDGPLVYPLARQAIEDHKLR